MFTAVLATLLFLLLSLVSLYGSNLQASVQRHLYEPVTKSSAASIGVILVEIKIIEISMIFCAGDRDARAIVMRFDPVAHNPPEAKSFALKKPFRY